MAKWRRLTQLLVFGFFTAYLAWPLAAPFGGWLFRIDPLAVGTAILGARTAFMALLFVLIPVALTLVTGRTFCGWLCPLGSLIDLTDLATRARRPNRIAWRAIKNHLLLILFGLAIGGVTLAWLFDPMFWAGHISGLMYGLGFGLFWVLGLFGGLLLVRAFLGRRGFCRVLCPLGALLGIIARHSLVRLDVSPKCRRCGDCVRNCRMAALDEQPENHLRAECIQCRECDTGCPELALRFRYGRTQLRSQPNLWRRSFLFSAIGATAVGIGLNRLDDWRRFPVLRPPGVGSTVRLERLCVRCGTCVRVCLTGGIRPDSGRGGWRAFQIPMLSARDGGCAFDCRKCGEACPTGAIQLLPLEQKQRLRIGHAWIDREQCFSARGPRQCMLCYLICPVQAIRLEPSTSLMPWQEPRYIPVVIESACTGCGLCAAICPTPGEGAILVRGQPQQNLLPESFDV